MTTTQPSPAHLCGQLYATLHTLRAIGKRDRQLANDSFLDRAKRHPGPQLREHLKKAGEHLLAARARGPKHGQAAGEVFRAIADFIPPSGRFPDYLDTKSQADFASGFHSQFGKYALTHDALFR
ncbi:hypothetical protein AB0M31_40640 [Streptomyces sp. NPDC051773]|uniref:hypothetical protein n=1 Tax=Streptomyces sp. NPDC051773 TaxID=3156682 RepID=UPI0034199238